MFTILDEFIDEIKRFGIMRASMRSGVSYKTIYNWVTGLRMPTLPKAQQVANAMRLEFLLVDKE